MCSAAGAPDKRILIAWVSRALQQETCPLGTSYIAGAKRKENSESGTERSRPAGAESSKESVGKGDRNLSFKNRLGG